jgi:hypothetical protein
LKGKHFARQPPLMTSSSSRPVPSCTWLPKSDTRQLLPGAPERSCPIACYVLIAELSPCGTAWVGHSVVVYVIVARIRA